MKLALLWYTSPASADIFWTYFVKVLLQSRAPVDMTVDPLIPSPRGRAGGLPYVLHFNDTYRIRRVIPQRCHTDSVTSLGDGNRGRRRDVYIWRLVRTLIDPKDRNRPLQYSHTDS